MLIHLMAGSPLDLLTGFDHALRLMREGAAACVRTPRPVAPRWACFPVQF